MTIELTKEQARILSTAISVYQTEQQQCLDEMEGQADAWGCDDEVLSWIKRDQRAIDILEDLYQQITPYGYSETPPENGN